MSLDTVKSGKNAVQNNNLIIIPHYSCLCGHWELPESAVLHSIWVERVALGGQ